MKPISAREFKSISDCRFENGKLLEALYLDDETVTWEPMSQFQRESLSLEQILELVNEEA